jgi:hypothetical protein
MEMAKAVKSGITNTFDALHMTLWPIATELIMFV